MKRNKTITRKIVLWTVTFCTAFIFSLYAQTASAVSLKERTVITDTVITLGDLFDGLPRDADKVLGPAPLPGKDMVLNARTLLRIALALDLSWKPKSAAEYVVLTRAATVITPDQIRDVLRNEIKAKGVSGNFDLQVPEDQMRMILPHGQPQNVEIRDIYLKHDQNLFEATLVAPSKENPVQTMRVSGAIVQMVDIPVLNSALRKGQIISKRDLTTLTLPQSSLKQDIILHAKDLIGTTPRRLIGGHEPVKANDIEDPQIVQRGEFITMIFQQGPLQLTARGKALQNGAKGDVIRVVNTGSNQTIEGTITAAKQVIVQSY